MGIIAKSNVEKHSEFTYGVHPATVEAVLGLNVCRLAMEEGQVHAVLRELEYGVMGARRSLIAKFDLLRQYIGYGLSYRIVVNDQSERSVQLAVYKRNKTNGEGQLSSVLSLGIGGHGEHYDFVSKLAQGEDESLEETGIKDLVESIDASFLRECAEEIEFFVDDRQIYDYSATSRAVGFVLDTKPEQLGYVGNHHFGVVYVTEVPAMASFQMTESNNDAVCWASVVDLKLHLQHGNQIDGPTHAAFEPWSRMIIEQLDGLEEMLLS